MVGNRCKVFCIGFAKTGTTSPKTVLEQFGHQTQDVVESVKLIEDWARRDYRSLIELCKKADAFQDVPFNPPFSLQALNAAFPGSKFVLTFRGAYGTTRRTTPRSGSTFDFARRASSPSNSGTPSRSNASASSLRLRSGRSKRPTSPAR
jgi:hypothetical protein